MSFGMVAASYLGVVDGSVPGPMLAFAFDEGSGTTFSPAIGSASGTVAIAYTEWIAGVHGSALVRWAGVIILLSRKLSQVWQ